MANIRSAIKRAEQAEERAQRNKATKTRVKNAVRSAVAAIATRDAAGARDALQRAEAVMDRAARKGVIHPNAAARRKSRLARRLNAQSAGSSGGQGAAAR